MLVVVGATSGITRIPAGTSNTWSHAWAITLDQWPVANVGEHRRDRVRLDRRPRLGPGLVEDAVEDPAVLHVAGEEAERELRGLGPGHLVAPGETARRRRSAARSAPRRGRSVRTPVERLGVEVGDAELELEVVQAALDLP